MTKLPQLFKTPALASMQVRHQDHNSSYTLRVSIFPEKPQGIPIVNVKRNE